MEKLNQADNLVFLPFLDLNDDQLAKIIIVAMKRSKWTVLHLNHNQITNMGVRYLCQTILANPSYLRNLNLDDNIITEDGYLELCQILECKDSNLQVLSLSGNFSSSKALEALGKSLPKSRLRVLSLNHCYIRDDAFLKLIANLNSTSLQQLWLDFNYISDIGLKALADIFSVQNSSSSYCLRLLSLEDNRFSDYGAIELAHVLSKMNLRELNISRNTVTDLGAQTFLRELKHSSITRVKLSTFSVSPVISREIHRMTRVLKSKEFNFIIRLYHAYQKKLPSLPLPYDLIKLLAEMLLGPSSTSG